MNLNDFSKWLQYNRVKNLRGFEYFPYPLYMIYTVECCYQVIALIVFICGHNSKGLFKKRCVTRGRGFKVVTCGVSFAVSRGQ